MGVPGCIANGIDKGVANKIFDEMTDFAAYAFNKSHAATYAMVCFQTAWLKYYYPVQFMAALMTSYIDSISRVAEYLASCKSMGITVLPPDINEGISQFSVKDGQIIYGLSAIKGIGIPVAEAVVRERQAGGAFSSMQDFIGRMYGTQMNKRAIECFIKAGACDCFGKTRKQQLLVYERIHSQAAQEKKKNIGGQMSLLDFMNQEERQIFEIRYPEVGEFERSQLLAFEKEMLGVYLSGHPLDDDRAIWEKTVTANATMFYYDEETGMPRLPDGAKVVVGGIITAKRVLTTKQGRLMAFVELEDLYGSIEVIVFPGDYEKHQNALYEDARVYFEGTVSVGEEENAKLISRRVIPFENLPQELWVQYEDKQAFLQGQEDLLRLLGGFAGDDRVIIFCKKEKAMKKLPLSAAVNAGDAVPALEELLGKENIRIRQVPISVR